VCPGKKKGPASSREKSTETVKGKRFLGGKVLSTIPEVKIRKKMPIPSSSKIRIFSLGEEVGRTSKTNFYKLNGGGNPALPFEEGKKRKEHQMGNKLSVTHKKMKLCISSCLRKVFYTGRYSGLRGGERSPGESVAVLIESLLGPKNLTWAWMVYPLLDKGRKVFF